MSQIKPLEWGFGQALGVHYRYKVERSPNGNFAINLYGRDNPSERIGCLGYCVTEESARGAAEKDHQTQVSRYLI